MALCIYTVEPIGVDMALEATETYWFCSASCRNASNVTGLHGENNEYISGTVCSVCEKVLPEFP